MTPQLYDEISNWNPSDILWDNRLSVQDDSCNGQTLYPMVSRAVLLGGLSAFMLSATAGSGSISHGTAAQALIRPASGVTNVVRREDAAEVLPEEKAAAFSVRQQVEGVLQHLGLNISEVARVLRVERPTVYNWMKDPKANLKLDNVERLRLVHELALYWKGLGAGRLQGRGGVPLEKGGSLLGLLAQPVIDQQAVQEAMDFIVAASPTIHGKGAPTTDLRERRRALNLPERSREEQDLNLEEHDIHQHFDVQ